MCGLAADDGVDPDPSIGLGDVPASIAMALSRSCKRRACDSEHSPRFLPLGLTIGLGRRPTIGFRCRPREGVTASFRVVTAVFGVFVLGPALATQGFVGKPEDPEGRVLFRRPLDVEHRDRGRSPEHHGNIESGLWSIDSRGGSATAHDRSSPARNTAHSYRRRRRSFDPLEISTYAIVRVPQTTRR